MLNYHARRHTEEKPNCNYCGKEFVNAVYVKKHEDNVCKMKSQTTQNTSAKFRKMRQGNGKKI